MITNRTYCFIAAFLVFCLPLMGSTPKKTNAHLQKTIEQARADLIEANKSLIRFREQVQQDRVSLAQEIAALSKQVAILQEEVFAFRQLASEKQDVRLAAQQKVQKNQEQRISIRRLLRDYRRSCEATMSTAEASYYSRSFDIFDEAQVQENSSISSLARQIFSLSKSTSSNAMKGFIYAGKCANPDGRILRGELFVIAGHAVFFGENTYGLCVNQANSSLPCLYNDNSEPFNKKNFKALFSGETALIPVDLSGKNNQTLFEEKRTLLQHLRQGGIVMVPLLLAGLAAIIISFIKALQVFRISRKIDAFDPALALQQVQTDNISTSLHQEEALGVLVEAIAEYKHEPIEYVEEIMHERLMLVSPKLERYLGTLAVLGGVAPLLGLLGTVTGIMRVFDTVSAFGTGDPGILSGGISEALVTTEVGLIIAISVLFVHAYLSRRTRNIMGQLERASAVCIQELHRARMD